MWRIAMVLLLGPVLVLLDTTIVSVGTAAVAHDLGGSLAEVQWVSTGYLLAVAVVMPLTGWATGRWGAKTVWLASTALFTAGSALCGAAWSVPVLVACRVLQGLGGALIQPVGQAMMAQAAGPERLGRVMSVSVVPVTLAPVAGPVLGGLLVQDLGWRWMFLVNVPLGILTLLAARKALPAGAPAAEHQARLDVKGLLLLPPGLAAVVYGCSAQRWSVLAAGLVLLAGYVAHALVRTRGGVVVAGAVADAGAGAREAASRVRPVPLLDVRMFARRGFAAATASSFLLGGSLYSAMLLLPLYFQSVRGADAMTAGLLLAPQALGTAAASLIAGRLTDRLGPRPLMLAGLLLALAGSLPFAFLAHAPGDALLTVALVVRGAGLGVAMIPGMSAVYGSVSREEAPRAAGSVNVLNRVGGSLGTAALTVVLQRSLAHHPAAPAVAYGQAFGWALGFSLLALVPALFYPRRAIPGR
ncbi:MULTISPECIES: MDR family MFS transporter [Streptomycetaceae]|uniref:EmrB/QacA family drug resistance transporter n=1 Tax=Streptantibioticus cattleyicolor (strain ATCC 35852 / DSM 46488 / JCM 4925 / NBRC 14057 / NRRL 8057) TaxID=1003195 RepID=F8JZ69_STREN|nr:MDR family MFS transporter [Streptantibioticus cattleyicolor]AEW94738.1 EmrB/QacA family drug resistance transporter [Streptantibioticus cattleyicolor NRRL 8057 = DSM 46488]MYS59367.1 MFS transporter [Streptomyces sp. SID5468]CCB75093.1 Putative transmembrane transport protein; putative multidrug efflux protein [Streptantibioticus cattleyicolor NRRL 8057 = DSM 46488]